ncbi:hypothetical protein ASPZODRAFT_232366 [Penicilliopsis zonata CBS 506.65]|uniref:Mid2 domain-containing protein n=1 Tax=Penicilliopsis zonata CBS 506.65 TaxID=1073090 RepID=A0A1L9SU42_9EURO|nr:hypothetical protein ASPZODRAFT_232366 [Penicilliopsis zonata CBS 506.65]OJJ50656.1 hypothetical protein ASPZODRAFT_232366 [Penicilliopsis zonata CBS 506.65]
MRASLLVVLGALCAVGSARPHRTADAVQPIITAVQHEGHAAWVGGQRKRDLEARATTDSTTSETTTTTADTTTSETSTTTTSSTTSSSTTTSSSSTSTTTTATTATSTATTASSTTATASSTASSSATTTATATTSATTTTSTASTTSSTASATASTSPARAAYNRRGEIAAICVFGSLGVIFIASSLTYCLRKRARERRWAAEAEKLQKDGSTYSVVPLVDAQGKSPSAATSDTKLDRYSMMFADRPRSADVAVHLEPLRPLNQPGSNPNRLSGYSNFSSASPNPGRETPSSYAMAASTQSDDGRAPYTTAPSPLPAPYQHPQPQSQQSNDVSEYRGF